jgi:hypothetical protein
MELVQTLVNAAVVAIVGLVLGRMLHGQRQEHREDIAALRTELKAEIAELRREMGEMRSDLTRVALAVGAETRTPKP